jgi:hypothetical protein
MRAVPQLRDATLTHETNETNEADAIGRGNEWITLLRARKALRKI